jgi:hypothetical protein
MRSSTLGLLRGRALLVDRFSHLLDSRSWVLRAENSGTSNHDVGAYAVNADLC